MNTQAVAIFDFDGTITSSDSYVAFILFLLKRYPTKLLKLPLLSTYTLAAVFKLRNNDWLKAQFLNALLADSNKQQVDSICDAFLDSWLDKHVKQDAIQQIEQHRDNGDLLVLLSASLDIYITKVGTRLGFNHTIATKAQWKHDKLTGSLAGNNLKGINKVAAILSSGLIDDSDHTITYADSLSDLPLFQWANKSYWLTSSKRNKSIAANHSNIEILRWK